MKILSTAIGAIGAICFIMGFAFMWFVIDVNDKSKQEVAITPREPQELSVFCTALEIEPTDDYVYIKTRNQEDTDFVRRLRLPKEIANQHLEQNISEEWSKAMMGY